MNNSPTELVRSNIKSDASIFTSASMIFNMYSGYVGLSFFFSEFNYNVVPMVNKLLEQNLTQELSINFAGLLVGVSLGYGADKIKSKGARNIDYNKAIGNKTGVINWRIITYSLVALSIFCLVFVGMQKSSLSIADNDKKIDELETKLQLHYQAISVLNPLDESIKRIQSAIEIANANIQNLINAGASKKEIKSAGYQLTDSKTGLNLMLSNAQKALSDNSKLQINRLTDKAASDIQAKIDSLKNNSPVSGFKLFNIFISWHVFSLFVGGVIIEYLIFASEQTVSFTSKNSVTFSESENCTSENSSKISYVTEIITHVTDSVTDIVLTDFASNEQVQNGAVASNVNDKNSNVFGNFMTDQQIAKVIKENNMKHTYSFIRDTFGVGTDRVINIRCILGIQSPKKHIEQSKSNVINLF